MPYHAGMKNAMNALNDFTRSLLDNMARASFPPLHTLPVGVARLSYAKAVSISSVPHVPLARVEDLSVPVREGRHIQARLWAPSTEPGLPVVLYLHGGGFVLGGVDTCEAMCRSVAQQSGAAVIAIDYRLAPEHPFPAALEDAWDTLQYLAKSGDGWDLDTRRLAIAGDSAGGTLSATCALMARDAGLPLRLQALFYPWVQGREETNTYKEFAQGQVLNAELIRWFDNLAKPAQACDAWWREPLYAPNHAQVAPAWIGIAECDPLADDGRMYAQALEKADVLVQLQEYKGTVHDFINMGRFLPQAAQAHADVVMAIKAAFTN
jgi:acetyl esterase